MEANVSNPASFIYKDLCTAEVKTSVTVLVYVALVPFGKREMISEGGWLGGGVSLNPRCYDGFAPQRNPPLSAPTKEIQIRRAMGLGGLVPLLREAEMSRVQPLVALLVDSAWQTVLLPSPHAHLQLAPHPFDSWFQPGCFGPVLCSPH